jgi:hypothetical protein
MRRQDALRELGLSEHELEPDRAVSDSANLGVVLWAIDAFNAVKPLAVALPALELGIRDSSRAAASRRTP